MKEHRISRGQDQFCFLMNKHKPQLFEGGLREHRGNCILASAAIPKFAPDCLHCLKLMEVPLANNMKTGLGILGKKLSPNLVPRVLSLSSRKNHGCDWSRGKHLSAGVGPPLNFEDWTMKYCYLGQGENSSYLKINKKLKKYLLAVLPTGYGKSCSICTCKISFS